MPHFTCESLLEIARENELSFIREAKSGLYSAVTAEGEVLTEGEESIADALEGAFYALEGRDESPKWEEHFGAFVDDLRERLSRGYKEYGDASYKRSDDELRREVTEEIMDIVGWSFIRWVKEQERG